MLDAICLVLETQEGTQLPDTEGVACRCRGGQSTFDQRRGGAVVVRRYAFRVQVEVPDSGDGAEFFAGQPMAFTVGGGDLKRLPVLRGVWIRTQFQAVGEFLG